MGIRNDPESAGLTKRRVGLMEYIEICNNMGLPINRFTYFLYKIANGLYL